MNNILKIVLNEGAGGTTTTFWWETNEADFDILTNYSFDFTYDTFLGYNVPLSWEMNDFYPIYLGTQLNQLFVNNNDWFPNNTFETPSTNLPAASCFWELETEPTGIRLHVDSINNNGLHSTGLSNIENYPTSNDPNAGYTWHYTNQGGGGLLSNYKIMPSIVWVTAVTYDAANEGLSFPAEGVKRVHYDNFDYLPEIYGVMSTQSLVPFNFGVTPDLAIDIFQYYRILSFSDRWADCYNYRVYNGYNGWTTNSVDLNENIHTGRLRLCYFDAAKDNTVTNKGWYYVNNDFLHKWRGMVLTGNTINEDLTSVVEATWDEHMVSFGLHSNPIDYYEPKGNADLFDLNYSPPNIYAENEWHPDLVTGGVYGISYNKLYSPTVFTLTCFTKEPISWRSNVRVITEMSFPITPHPSLDNSEQLLNSSYIDGSNDNSSNPTGEFTSAAVSSIGVANGSESSPPAPLLGAGIWYNHHEGAVQTGEFAPQSVGILQGSLRLKKAGDNSAIPTMLCSVKLYSSRSYRIFFKISRKTKVQEGYNNSFKVSIWNGGNTTNSDYLIGAGKINLDGNSQAISNSFLSNNYNNHNSLAINFNTPVLPKELSEGSMGTANIGNYKIKIECTGSVQNFDLHIEYIRFSSNVSGLTYESLDYVASRFSSPRKEHASQGEIIPSCINAHVPFTITTALDKSKRISDSSIVYSTSGDSDNYAVEVTAGGNNPNSTFLRIQSTTGTALQNFVFTNANCILLDAQSGVDMILNGNTDCSQTTMFPHEIADQSDSHDNGVITFGNYAYAFVEFSIKVKNVSGWQGTSMTLRLINQSGGNILNANGVPIYQEITIPSNGNSTSVLLSSHDYGWNVTNSNPIDLTGVTSISVKIDEIPFPGGGADILEFTTPNTGSIFKVQPVTMMQGLEGLEWVPYNPTEAQVIPGSHSNFNNDESTIAQTRSIKSTKLTGFDSEESYHFSPLSKLTGDSQGFYYDDEIIRVNGRLKVFSHELSIFANTDKFKSQGYSCVNAKIHSLSFTSNENSYITREDESTSTGGSGINLYWNPTSANTSTLQPYITISVPDFINTSGNVEMDIVGTTPTITLTISKWEPAPASSGVSNLMIRSGGNCKVIAQTIGQVQFQLEMGSTMIEILPTMFSTSTTENDSNINSFNGIDLVINEISYGNTSDTVNIYTSFDNDGQGLKVDSNAPTVVPQGNVKYRYYVLANEDNVMPDGTAFETPFIIQGTPSTPIVSTSILYDESYANNQAIGAWYLLSAPLAVAAYIPSSLTFNPEHPWYLPSRDELTQALNVLGASGGVLDGYTYPTSTADAHWTSSTGLGDATKVFTVDLTNPVSAGTEEPLTSVCLIRAAMNFNSSVEYNIGDSHSGGTIWKKEQLSAPTQTLKIIKIVDEIPDSANAYISPSFSWLTTGYFAGWPVDENLAYFNAIISQCSSLSDGYANTENLNTLLGVGAADDPYEIASSSTFDGHSDWYIPSSYEWSKINANVGLALDPSDPLYDAVNFTDASLTLIENNFYCSTIFRPSPDSGLTPSSFRVYNQQVRTDGLIGFSPAPPNFRLRLAREVEVNNFTGNIGDSYGTDSIIYDIIQKGVGLIPPSIERWWSTVQILSMAGLDCDWGDLNEIKIEYTLDVQNPYNKTLFCHNFTQPETYQQYTYNDSGTPSYYQWPIQENLQTGTAYFTYTQPEGISNQDILQGKAVGIKLIFTNTSANQYLGVNLRYIKLHLTQLSPESSIEHDIRKEVILDLYSQDDFSSTYCVKDFNNLDKGASDYTKTLKVPATASNKTAFASTSNIKGGTLNDVYSGVPANIYSGGVNIFKGLAFLNKVSYSDNAKQEDLEIVFRGGNASWFSLLKELKLQDIPRLNSLYEYSMARAFSEPQTSSALTLPLIDKGKLPQHATNIVYLTSDNLTPAYKIKTVIELIFDYINYNLSSNFMHMQGEFSGFEFSNEFSGLFDSFIAVTPPAKIPEYQIEKSKIKLSFNNQNYKSKRAAQTNNGSTWVGNHLVSDYYFHRTPTLKSWGPSQYNNVAVDFRPLAFTDIQHLNQDGGAVVSLSSSLSANGAYIGVSGNTSGLDGQFSQTPLSWGSVSDSTSDSSLSGTTITVPRSGYYDVNSNSRVDFTRDEFLYDYQDIVGDVNPYALEGGLIESSTYRAGIKKTSKFTVLLVPYNSVNNEIYINEKSFYESYFRRTDESTFEYENDDNITNHHISLTQRQYLKEGEVYYAVAFNVEKINKTAYNDQMAQWFNEGDTSTYALSQVIDSLLVSGGDIKYIHRAFFTVRECNLEVSLSENPIIDTWTAFYKTSATPKISISDILPEITALEFVSEISKLFNLVWTTNDITKTVKAEPYNDFYKMSSGNMLREFVDWTDIAYIKEQKVNSVLPSTLKYEYAKDSSDKTSTSDTSSETFVNFGNISLNLNPSSTTEQKVGLKVFSTARMAKAYDIYIDGTALNDDQISLENKKGLYLMRVYGDDKFTGYVSNNFKPDDLTTFNHKFASTIGRRTMSQIVELNGIPENSLDEYTIVYAYYSAAFGNSYDMTRQFNGVMHLDTAYTYSDFSSQIPTLTFSNKASSSEGSDLNLGLYHTYHKAQIEMLKFADKMVVAEVKLTPADINNLDFSKPIKINNDYYIINKIKDYNPIGESPTKVELLLIHPRGTKEAL